MSNELTNKDLFKAAFSFLFNAEKEQSNVEKEEQEKEVIEAQGEEVGETKGGMSGGQSQGYQSCSQGQTSTSGCVK